MTINYFSIEPFSSHRVSIVAHQNSELKGNSKKSIGSIAAREIKTPCKLIALVRSFALRFTYVKDKDSHIYLNINSIAKRTGLTRSEIKHLNQEKELINTIGEKILGSTQSPRASDLESKETMSDDNASLEPQSSPDPEAAMLVDYSSFEQQPLPDLEIKNPKTLELLDEIWRFTNAEDKIPLWWTFDEKEGSFVLLHDINELNENILTTEIIRLGTTFYLNKIISYANEEDQIERIAKLGTDMFGFSSI